MLFGKYSHIKMATECEFIAGPHPKVFVIVTKSLFKSNFPIPAHQMRLCCRDLPDDVSGARVDVVLLDERDVDAADERQAGQTTLRTNFTFRSELQHLIECIHVQHSAKR